MKKNMKKIVLLPIIDCLGDCFLIIALLILNLNFLIVIINVIILLNILFVISYYLNNLSKNTIFWEVFKILTLYIIVLIVCLIIFSSECYAESPEPQCTEVLVENIQKNSRDLQEKLLVKRIEFNNQQNSFNIKVDRFSNYFNNVIFQVEFRNTEVLSYIRPSLQGNNSIWNAWRDVMIIKDKEIQEEAGILLKKIDELEAIDARIHSFSQTNFDNKEYQKLSLYYSQYRSSKWCAIKHPNKILTQMNLTNRYF